MGQASSCLRAFPYLRLTVTPRLERALGGRIHHHHHLPRISGASWEPGIQLENALPDGSGAFHPSCMARSMLVPNQETPNPSELIPAPDLFIWNIREAKPEGRGVNLQSSRKNGAIFQCFSSWERLRSLWRVGAVSTGSLGLGEEGGAIPTLPSLPQLCSRQACSRPWPSQSLENFLDGGFASWVNFGNSISGHHGKREAASYGGGVSLTDAGMSPSSGSATSRIFQHFS